MKAYPQKESTLWIQRFESFLSVHNPQIGKLTIE